MPSFGAPVLAGVHALYTFIARGKLAKAPILSLESHIVPRRYLAAFQVPVALDLHP